MRVISFGPRICVAGVWARRPRVLWVALPPGFSHGHRLGWHAKRPSSRVHRFELFNSAVRSFTEGPRRALQLTDRTSALPQFLQCRSPGAPGFCNRLPGRGLHRVATLMWYGSVASARCFTFTTSCRQGRYRVSAGLAETALRAGSSQQDALAGLYFTRQMPCCVNQSRIVGRRPETDEGFECVPTCRSLASEAWIEKGLRGRNGLTHRFPRTARESVAARTSAHL